MRYASDYGSIQYFACTQRVMALFAFSSSRVLQNFYDTLFTPSWDACGTCCCRGRRGLFDCEPSHYIHVVLPACRSPFTMQPPMSLLRLGADRAILCCPAKPYSIPTNVGPTPYWAHVAETCLKFAVGQLPERTTMSNELAALPTEVERDKSRTYFRPIRGRSRSPRGRGVANEASIGN